MPKLYQSTDDHHYYTKLHRGSDAGIVTYQIHPQGAILLKQHRIYPGHEIPRILIKELERRKLMYTGGSGVSPMEPLPPIQSTRHQTTTMNLSSKPGYTAKPNSLPKPGFIPKTSYAPKPNPATTNPIISPNWKVSSVPTPSPVKPLVADSDKDTIHSWYMRILSPLPVRYESNGDSVLEPAGEVELVLTPPTRNAPSFRLYMSHNDAKIQEREVRPNNFGTGQTRVFFPIKIPGKYKVWGEPEMVKPISFNALRVTPAATPEEVVSPITPAATPEEVENTEHVCWLMRLLRAIKRWLSKLFSRRKSHV